MPSCTLVVGRSFPDGNELFAADRLPLARRPLDSIVWVREWGRGLQYHFHKNGFAKDIFRIFWFLLGIMKTIPLQLGHHLSDENGEAGQE